MRQYLVCMGAPSWARRVFWQLSQGQGAWYVPVTDAGELLREAQDRRPRYAFFVNWSVVVPAEVVGVVECVNFHCTRLPYGRGGHPIENLILRGHSETVITAHRMTEEVDAGPIYGVSGPVSLAGTKEEILDRFVRPVAALLKEIVRLEPPPIPQDGPVVRFRRLRQEQYYALWQAREKEASGA